MRTVEHGLKDYLNCKHSVSPITNICAAVQTLPMPGIIKRIMFLNQIVKFICIRNLFLREIRSCSREFLFSVKYHYAKLNNLSYDRRQKTAIQQCQIKFSQMIQVLSFLISSWCNALLFHNKSLNSCIHRRSAVNSYFGWDMEF